MKERNQGIDFLRILSMLGVIILHISGKGLGNNASDVSCCLYFIQTMALCSVNCFALISGYNLYNKKLKLHNLFYLHAIVLFYSIGIMLLAKFVCQMDIPVSEIIYSFLPVMTSRYWYFSAYFGMFLLMPAINILIAKSTKKESMMILLSIIIVGTILTLLKDGNDVSVIGLRRGYSTMWLCFCYYAGGIINKYNILRKINTNTLIRGGGMCVLITFVSVLLINYLIKKTGLAENFIYVLFRYNSPTIFLYSILLLEIFSRINFQRYFLQKPMELLVRTSFSVYIIHSNVIVNNYIIIGILGSISNAHIITLMLAILGISAIIYCICTLIDCLRIIIFDLFQVKHYCLRFSTYIESIISKIVDKNYF